MLQQTRVAAVLEHYHAFLRQFPNVRALASVSEPSVLAVWSGLGYYRRARMMRLCAETIVQEHGGRFPKTSELLQRLPGIGRYTAAAVASIAFGEPVAVVDGNVERVLGRLHGNSLSKKQHWLQAQELITTARSGDHNQAMMELGATLCTPRQPKCGSCPIKTWCATQGESLRTLIPAPQQKKEIWCSLAQRNGHVHLVQRDATASLMAGMWELPQQSDPSNLEPTPSSGLRQRHIGTTTGAGLTSWRTFRHSITKTDYTVHVIRQAATRNGKWISVDRISSMPITGLTRKILKAAGII